MSVIHDMDITIKISDYLSPLQVRCVRLHCIAEKTLIMQIPPMRGTWGLAVRQLDQQLYNQVFEGINPLSPPGQKYPKYIVRPDLQCSYEKNKKFSFEFLTWNITDEQYYTLLTAWNIVAMYGLGKERIPFKIENAEPLFEPSLKCQSLTNVHTLTFPHSVRLMQKGKLVTKLMYYDVILAVLYRLAPIVAEANGRIPSANPKDDWMPEYPQILDLAKDVKSSWFGQELILQRYSARQQCEVKQKGVYGIMNIKNAPEELRPLLEIADLLHIGKTTILGLGRCVPRTEE